MTRVRAQAGEATGVPRGAAPAPFVVGVGRSGTTLLRMMLDAHPRLAIPPEVNFGAAIVAFEEGRDARAVAEAFIRSGRWGDFKLPAEDFLARVEADGAETLGDVLRAFYRLYAERQGKARWGNKTPYHLARMSVIQGFLPEARFIHLIRDGRDVALSMAPLWFGADDVAGVAEEWARGLASARRQAPGLDHYLEVRYEDLLRDPATALRRICSFAELEWAPQMLDYHRRAGNRLDSEIGDSVEAGRRVSKRERLAVWQLVDRPPQRDRIGVWRRQMDPADRRAFERVAGDTLRDFGYELS